MRLSPVLNESFALSVVRSFRKTCLHFEVLLSSAQISFVTLSISDPTQDTLWEKTAQNQSQTKISLVVAS